MERIENDDFQFRIVLLGWIVLLLVGCSQIIIPNTPEGAELLPLETSEINETKVTPISLTQVMDTPDRMEETMTKKPERVPATEATTPMVGEVPTELLESILKDLAKRTGTSPENIGVIQAQTIVWNDGSLGCAQPGMFYTQALVNGYWVIMELDEKNFDYRASETGYFFLCENGSLPISPPGTPSS